MNILLVNPRFPDTFWSYKHAIKFISKKATNPPLGLITVAALLPKTWSKKLIDLNFEQITANDLHMVDYVFISAMTVQQQSVYEIIKLCKENNIKTVAGGPLFTSYHERFQEIDHLLLNEAELTLPEFISDLKNKTPKREYSTDCFSDIQISPVPSFELLNMKNYVMMNIQYSRGCPYDCDFCDITVLYGSKVRTKNKEQIIKELDTLYKLNWKGDIFIVDDNFIGNKNILKKDVLPAMINWMENHNFPFSFTTEVSIDLADDPVLMNLMRKSGFNSVFVGIETPEEKSLNECNKQQNIKRDLLKSINSIQQNGFQVTGGFIVGFDNDSPTIFKKQINFIQNSGIVTAMVGMLNAPKNTKLWKKLKKEKRLTNSISGNNTDLTVNFKPKMGYNILRKGYIDIIKGIYAPKPYYLRVKNCLRSIKPFKEKRKTLSIDYIKGFIKSLFIIGIFNKGQIYYWKLLIWCLIKKPFCFKQAVTYAVYGYHFRKVFKNIIY